MAEASTIHLLSQARSRLESKKHLKTLAQQTGATLALRGDLYISGTEKQINLCRHSAITYLAILLSPTSSPLALP